jgi:pimeloyl-ACP methyl ester carboxylesterase
VLLIAGTDDPIQRWDGLVDELGQEVLACRFDADDASSSGPLAGAVTPAVRADALIAALRSARLPGPYVLVGHSLGGLTVRQFGARHGGQLGGALLLDPTTPVALASLHRQLTTSGWDASAAQAEAEASVEWPDVPLVVLSHDPTEVPFGDPVVENLWTQGQRDYGGLTDGATVEAVRGAGHYVDRDAPKQVVRVIDDLIRRAGGN